MIERWNGMAEQGDEVKDILRMIVRAGVENVGPLLISRAEKALEAMENMNMDTVSVPREPTEAMVSAAINVFAKHPRTREQTARFRDTVRNAIKAALSTAPASPVVGEDAIAIAADAIAIADGQDPKILTETYNGRMRISDYRRFARTVLTSIPTPTAGRAEGLEDAAKIADKYTKGSNLDHYGEGYCEAGKDIAEEIRALSSVPEQLCCDTTPPPLKP